MLRRAERRSGQDARWLAQVRRSGTAADRVAAATLLLQESAAANLDALDELLKWVGKRSGARAMAGQARARAAALMCTLTLMTRQGEASAHSLASHACVQAQGLGGGRCLVQHNAGSTAHHVCLALQPEPLAVSTTCACCSVQRS